MRFIGDQLRRRFGLASLSLALGAACTGDVGPSLVGGSEGGDPTQGGPGAGTGNPVARASGPGGTGGAGTGAGVTPGTGVNGGGIAPPPAASCQGTVEKPAPRRLWRLSKTQHRNTVASVLGGRRSAAKPVLTAPAELSSIFEAVDGSQAFDNFSISYTMSDLEFSQMLDSSVDVGRRVIAQLRAEPAACKGFADCLKSLLDRKAPLIFRRPLTTEELDFYRALGTNNLAALGEDEGLLLVLQGLLASPRFLYRIEMGQPAGAGHARLDPFEVASALSYSLLDGPPDEDLWKAAEMGALGKPDEIRTQVRRLWEAPGEHPAAANFLKQYFKYERVTSVNKDAKAFPFHNAFHLEEDTDNFIKDVLATNGRRDFLTELLTSTSGFVRGNTAQNYGVALAPKETRSTKVSFPPGQRSGILTQASVLVSFSDTDKTDPVLRGKYVSENFLCREIPEPPANVPPIPVLGPTSTVRERVAQHSADPKCAACHKLMDPIGLGFEVYDHLGRFRTKEGMVDANGSGELTSSGNSDGPFTGVVELGKRLAASSVVSQCFVTQNFRFLMGRHEEEGDSCTLANGQNAFVKSSGDYVELVAALFSSSNFLLRATP